MALSQLESTVRATRLFVTGYELLTRKVQAVPEGNCKLRTLYTGTTNTEHIKLRSTGIGEKPPTMCYYKYP